MLVPGFCFDNGEFMTAIDEDVVCNFRFASATVSFEPARSDVFSSNPASFDDPQPAAFNAGSICSALVSASFSIGQVSRSEVIKIDYWLELTKTSQFTAEGLVQQRLLQLLKCVELALVDGFKALGFTLELFDCDDYAMLLRKRRWK